ncbi:DUF1433 domain-containing protein [Bacillus haynesii]|uniref:DUF1433 domain-containing protein n=1 Tax=Bacillus haynesii TaxID=1925021 RepID=UPI00227F0A68|nr:DUF1433 domain-containing protein [Bacillus haynesii]MCY7770664.1 DUF1433 domain-containing protein [Bacillus haynesii]MCY8001431.1 DUF1433 domain-containing protein [Bacillus haynesii]MCY8012201.1 DUF1433 domain-containing protein [Bacillus haynesii]MCY8347784.1 DUF1433 domain-containing protein [Bacillus haynesii]MCY8350577.1 DUF1433 domain-containing protein [Bacillus haynesii]
MRKYIIILIVLCIIAFGGIFMEKQIVNGEKEELYILAKERMTDFIKKNYKDIKSIDYSDDCEVNPMGGIDIKGYLNGDKQKEIWGIYDKTNDEIGSFTVDAEKKPECEDKICEY